MKIKNSVTPTQWKDYSWAGKSDRENVEDDESVITGDAEGGRRKGLHKRQTRDIADDNSINPT